MSYPYSNSSRYQELKTKPATSYSNSAAVNTAVQQGSKYVVSTMCSARLLTMRCPQRDVLCSPRYARCLLRMALLLERFDISCAILSLFTPILCIIHSAVLCCCYTSILNFCF